MPVRYIPDKIKFQLWGKAAGRCEYEGCNKPLWIDLVTKAEFNTAYIAHIIADKENGPRGDPVLSHQLKKDISNLMLMCDEHHRLIDREDIEGHPVRRLHGMKRKHEQRIELLTSLTENLQSHVILYGANIGEHSASLSWEKAYQAMLPKKYPAEKPCFELSLKNSSFEDCDEDYWNIEKKHLQKQYAQIVKPRLYAGDIDHLSIFALAPQPLLIELGRLISDIPAAEVYQLHREPANWRWQEHPAGIQFIVQEPGSICKIIALNLSLSATINNSRIFNVLGDDVSVWSLSIDTPNNDFLKSQEQLAIFRQTFRKLLDDIKSIHGQDSVIHLFPAIPVAIAVEIGRVWMPKADLALCIYDQNQKLGGFAKVLESQADNNQEV